MTKEERIREKEEEISKITNLKVYEDTIFKKSLKTGVVAGMALSAIPLSFSVLSNVFGVNFQVDNTGFVGDFVNNFYQAVTYWPAVIGVGATGVFSALTGAFLGSHMELNKVRKQKYYMDNKDDINAGLKDITILDVENFSKEQLEDYANRGRSKVLR
mgnify:CR=1 FL=1